MKIIAVVGTESGCGKTTVACCILRAIPGLGAVKISPRGGASRVEWGAGELGKDTSFFFESGAAPVARIIGSRDAVGLAWEQIKGRFDGCHGVVIEGASALEIPGERFVIFVDGDTGEVQREARNRAIVAISTVIINRSSHYDAESLANAIRSFLAGSANRGFNGTY